MMWGRRVTTCAVAVAVPGWSTNWSWAYAFLARNRCIHFPGNTSDLRPRPAYLSQSSKPRRRLHVAPPPRAPAYPILYLTASYVFFTFCCCAPQFSNCFIFNVVPAKICQHLYEILISKLEFLPPLLMTVISSCSKNSMSNSTLRFVYVPNNSFSAVLLLG